MIMTIEEIKKVLPHREPFLMVDRVDELEVGKSCTARKAVSGNEWFFQGHFNEVKVMPGVLILEAMAQAGGIAILSDPEMKDGLAYLGKIKNAKFSRKVIPGDTLILKSTIETMKMGIGMGKCKAYVDGELAAEASVIFAIEKEAVIE